MTAPVLAVDQLGISYRRRGRWLPAVLDVTLDLLPGEAVGVVGESGCGKSTLAMAALGYLPGNARVDGGDVRIEGRSLTAMSAEELRRLRGASVAAVYQNPGAALNPSITVGAQVAEVYRLHAGHSREQARDAAEEMLGRVRIPAPGGVLDRYPYQLSGGMQQRVVIAMALAGDPSLLILDEPTTALDATVQAEILDLFALLRDDFRAAMLFISHDLGVVQFVCDRVGVMYAGEMVEQGEATAVFERPRHPYTASLIDCIPDIDTRKGDTRLAAIPGIPPALGARPEGCAFAPRCPIARQECAASPPPLRDLGGGRHSRCLFPDETAARGGNRRPVDSAGGPAGAPVLNVQGVSLSYGHTRVLRDIGLTVRRAQTVALVGESGSGKTTLARAITGLATPESGSVALGDLVLRASAGRRSHHVRQRLQMVFQSPDGTLNPSHRVGGILGRAVRVLAGVNRRAARDRVGSLLDDVALERALAQRRPTQLSGGQRQRVAIARAFAGSPELVILDEPTSALDVSVQAAILDLLLALQQRDGVAYLFISHDLAVVRYLADRVAVMYLGEIVEEGPVEAVFGGHCHPYTEALIAAVPRPGGGQSRVRLAGHNPGPDARPAGCPFHTRCPYVHEACRRETPPWRTPREAHRIRCHLPLDEMPVSEGSRRAAGAQ